MLMMMMMMICVWSVCAVGRCVTSDFGYLHCVQDVMLELQSACSARRTCSIRVDDTAFTRVKPCHRDLKSYLIVTYRCTTGMHVAALSFRWR